jgi:hypothetical protein
MPFAVLKIKVYANTEIIDKFIIFVGFIIHVLTTTQQPCVDFDFRLRILKEHTMKRLLVWCQRPGPGADIILTLGRSK